MNDITYRRFEVPNGPTEDLRGWFDAAGIGFLQDQASDESLTRWRDEVSRDGWLLAGAYAPASEFSLGAHTPVGTFATTTQTINTGGGRLTPACFITDVTVRPTHRRRGILTAMMSTALERAKADGIALAALTVSEGGIYGRFGFGVATSYTKAELDSGPRFALTRPVTGHVELIAPETSVAVRRQVFDAFHAAHRGSHQRLAFYDAYLSGQWDYDKGGPDKGMRAAVHLDAAGAPDGVVAYSVDGENGVVRVRDLLALTGAAELGLWRFLASIDLTEKVEIRRLAPDSALPWALPNPRLLKITGAGDFTWLRVLDVAAALAARGFDADGDAAFSVDDRLGHAAGSYVVHVRDGVAEVTPSAAHPTIELDVRALASLYFGLVDARTLRAAGQINGPKDAVAALGHLFRTDAPAHNTAGF